MTSPRIAPAIPAPLRAELVAALARLLVADRQRRQAEGEPVQQQRDHDEREARPA